MNICRICSIELPLRLCCADGLICSFSLKQEKQVNETSAMDCDENQYFGGPILHLTIGLINVFRPVWRVSRLFP